MKKDIGSFSSGYEKGARMTNEISDILGKQIFSMTSMMEHANDEDKHWYATATVDLADALYPLEAMTPEVKTCLEKQLRLLSEACGGRPSEIHAALIGTAMSKLASVLCFYEEVEKGE